MVLLQRRSLYSHDGGTWSCAGGALDELEDPLEGALREAWEEIGPIPTHRVVGSFVFQPATDWAYTTFVVQVDEQFDTMPNFESEEITWIAIDSVPQLSLHRGFSAAWSHLAALVQSVGIAG